MTEFSLGDAVLGTEVDLSGIDQGLADAETKTSSGFSTMAANIGSILQVGILGAVAAVGAAVIGLGTVAVDTAAQFNQSQNDIQAALGLTEGDAARLTDVARGVFGDNFGTDIADVTQSLIDVRTQMKGLADKELQAVTEKALTLRDVFGVEVPESTNAANVLMEKFGLSADQAFDFITTGFQKGLNTSGDFLESITEYGVQFSDAGFDADQFFSVMETGQQAGVLGTDKISDAFKEFRIRVSEDSAAVFGPSGVLTTQLGMTSSEATALADGMASGSITAADAYALLMPKIAALDDPIAQNAAGVALFGTQWEDLGPKAMLAIDVTRTGLDDMAGSTDALAVKYDNWGSIWEGFKRQAALALEPTGQKLLDLAGQAMPLVEQGFQLITQALEGTSPLFDALAAVILPALHAIWENVLMPAIAEGQAFFQNDLMPILEDLGKVVVPAFELALAAIGAVWDSVLRPALSALWGIVKDNILPVIKDVAGWIGDNLPGAFVTAKRELGSFKTNVLDPIGAGFQWIADKVSGALDWIRDLIDTLSSVRIPDWLQGHSPPPMADWFGSIADEAERSAMAFDSLQMPPIAMPAAGALAAGGAAGALGASVALSIDDRGLGWLRNLIRVEVRGANLETGRRAEARRRAGG